jgi:hypothetical protein
MLNGEGPLTLLGANGAGKTRLGAWFVDNRGYDRVSAQRMVSLSNIGMMTTDQAKGQTRMQLESARSDLFNPTNDLQSIIAEMKAVDVDSASVYKKKGLVTGGQPGTPEETQLDVVVRLWQTVFSGRTLDMSTYSPQAKWDSSARTTNPYSTGQMSDGERSALYHIARLLRAEPGVVVIDEPEIHFHALLARRFWDLIEAQRTDCRFIYITHDIPFALSRRGQIGIVRGPDSVEVLPEKSGIPADLFEGILGAASLSIVASRIVFCEGTPENSLDLPIYGAWFKAPATAVIPAGSCDDVKRTFETFQKTRIIRNAQPLAVVERDYWPESYLQKLTGLGLHVLPTHEVEGLIALKNVARAVAAHMAVVDFDGRYAEFEQRVRAKYTKVDFNKQVLERAKRDIDTRLLGLPNTANPHAEVSQTRQNLVTAVNLTRAVPDVGAVFDEHQQIAIDALQGSGDDMLKIFPGKTCLGLLCDALGVPKENYIRLVVKALNGAGENEPGFQTLEQAIVAALQPHLPSRVPPASPAAPAPMTSA